MTVSDSTLSKSSLALALFFAVGAVYLKLSGNPDGVNLFITLPTIAIFLYFAYALSARFKQNNTLDNLITRNGDTLHCKSAGALSNVTIKTASIDVVTILDGYLSIIEKNNGNGYDFYLDNSADEIKHYWSGLFSDSELGNIKLSCKA